MQLVSLVNGCVTCAVMLTIYRVGQKTDLFEH